jgi:4-hydroxybenzoyl-CoA thioesterase
MAVTRPRQNPYGQRLSALSADAAAGASASSLERDLRDAGRRDRRGTRRRHTLADPTLRSIGSSAMSGVHVHLVEVRFGDCDPAGIIYFPRFFALFHDAMETWFPARLGLRYSELVVGRKIGFPAVHTEADFQAPCALGDAIAVELRVAAARPQSPSNLQLCRARRGRAMCGCSGATTCVVMDLDPASPELSSGPGDPRRPARADRALHGRRLIRLSRRTAGTST